VEGSVRKMKLSVPRSVLVKSILISILILLLIWINVRYLQFSPRELREWIMSFGWWSPVIYIALQIVRPYILFPASVMSITAGLAFGPVLGTVYTLTGVTAGAVAAFITARKFGRRVVRREWQERYEKVRRKVEENGFFYVLLFRLIPFVHYDLISYASGLSRIPLRAFVWGTLLGVIPGSIGYNFLGSSLVESDVRLVLVSIVFLATFLGIAFLFRKKIWAGLQRLM
jgi:uncharacterized membrane protein YdjX (TVP38/TMEM64 family)